MKLSLQTVQTLLMVIVVPVLGYIARKQADQGERLARIEQAITDQRHEFAVTGRPHSVEDRSQ